MQRLHEWYLNAAKEGQIMLMAKVNERHLLQDFEVCIMFEEFFELYNQDALDKSLVSCYCL